MNYNDFLDIYMNLDPEQRKTIEKLLRIDEKEEKYKQKIMMENNPRIKRFMVSMKNSSTFTNKYDISHGFLANQMRYLSTLDFYDIMVYSYCLGFRRGFNQGKKKSK